MQKSPLDFKVKFIFLHLSLVGNLTNISYCLGFQVPCCMHILVESSIEYCIGITNCIIVSQSISRFFQENRIE